MVEFARRGGNLMTQSEVLGPSCTDILQWPSSAKDRYEGSGINRLTARNYRPYLADAKPT